MKPWKVVVLGMAGAFFGVMLLAGMAFWADIFKVDQNGVVYFRVTDAGNVGIGNPAPDPGSRLVVQGTGTTSSTSAMNITAGDGTSRMLVRDDGNVGIGTTAPQGKLMVLSGAKGTNNPGVDQIKLSTTDVTNQLQLIFQLHGTATAANRHVEIIALEQNVAYLPLVLNPVGGNVGIGATSPDSILELGGTDAAMSLNEDSATPASPASGAEARVYMKADKLVIQYNDAGTVKYRYLTLNDTTATWTYTTTAP